MSKTANKISILGLSSDLGANQAGARMGPDAIRVAGLHRKLRQLGYQVRDKGNVYPSMREYGRDGASNYLAEIVALNEQVMKYVTEAFDEGATPLVLGGDHSLAIGSTAASAARYGNLGVVWIDTHADMNNPQSSVTKNIHGMPLSTLLHDGYQELIGLVQNKLDPKKIVLIGLRDLDKTERILLAKSGVNYFTMRDVDEIGIQGVLEILTTKIFKEVAHLHVSFDLDVMDPIYAPGVSTPINGGLNTREAHLLLEMLHETKKIRACDFVELNPMKDMEGKSAVLMVNLIASLFGSTII